MKIISYSELGSKHELLPLFQHAFWWPFNPREFEKIIREDPRLRDSPVGYVAVVDNQTVGFVGVMDIATRTLDKSEEMVGGIWGVVTHPVYARQGIFNALMQKSHIHFKEQGYDFSFLFTSKILVAYAMYLKLGYEHPITYPSAYKTITEKRMMDNQTPKKATLDWKKLIELHHEATLNNTGFVIRDSQYGKMLEARKTIQPEKTVIVDDGYALLKDDEGTIYIKELVSLSKRGADQIISEIERKATLGIVCEKVSGKAILESFKSHGYTIMNEGYDLLIAKALATRAFEETYGDIFHASAADFF